MLRIFTCKMKIPNDFHYFVIYHFLDIRNFGSLRPLYSKELLKNHGQDASDAWLIFFLRFGRGGWDRATVSHLKNENMAGRDIRISAACYLYVWEHFILKTEHNWGLIRRKHFLFFLHSKMFLIYEGKYESYSELRMDRNVIWNKVLMNRIELKTLRDK